MKLIKHTLKEYQDISAEAWGIFKKYFPDDANLDEFEHDIDLYDSKHKDNPRLYCFWMSIMRVFFCELFELKQKAQPEYYEFYLHIDKIFHEELAKFKESMKNK